MSNFDNSINLEFLLSVLNRVCKKKYSSYYFVIIIFLNSGNLKFELDQIEKVPVECNEKSGMTQEGVMVNLEDLDLGIEKPT